MKAKEKVMITSITSAIELTVKPAWEQPKKVINMIEKSARRLARKLTKDVKSEKKQLAKA